MLRRAKHGLITARLGWTNSWTHLRAPSVPASLHSSHGLSIHPLVSVRPPIRLKSYSRLISLLSSGAASPSENAIAHFIIYSASNWSPKSRPGSAPCTPATGPCLQPCPRATDADKSKSLPFFSWKVHQHQIWIEANFSEIGKDWQPSRKRSTANRRRGLAVNDVEGIKRKSLYMERLSFPLPLLSCRWTTISCTRKPGDLVNYI